MSLTETLDSAGFDLPPSAPFAPGTSPFRIAGVAYRGVLDFVRSEVPGGLDRVRGELRDQRLSEFIRQPFQTTSHYDVVPLPYLGQAIARSRGITFAQQLRDSNRYSEERAGVVYRALLKVMTAEMVALAIPRAATIAHDFGRARASVTGERRVRGERTGVPRVLVRWLALSNGYYLEFAMARAGARAPRVTFEAPEAEGEKAGQTLFRLPFEVAWG